MNGPRSGLYEDFIEREKGIGNLEEVCEGASPRSLAEPRDDGYTKVTPRRICDRVSGPRSGLYEDFIEREKGIGNLEEVCEGASPRSLAETRDDSYTKVTPRRIFDRVSGPRSGLYEDFIEREKGLGTLRRYVKGQVLDPSRRRGMTVIQRSRLGASATG